MGVSPRLRSFSECLCGMTVKSWTMVDKQHSNIYSMCHCPMNAWGTSSVDQVWQYATCRGFKVSKIVFMIWVVIMLLIYFINIALSAMIIIYAGAFLWGWYNGSESRKAQKPVRGTEAANTWVSSKEQSLTTCPRMLSVPTAFPLEPYAHLPLKQWELCFYVLSVAITPLCWGH